MPSGDALSRARPSVFAVRRMDPRTRSERTSATALSERGFELERVTREYRAELLMIGPIDSGSATIKNHGQKFWLRLIKLLARSGNVTLMCHCAEDTTRCRLRSRRIAFRQRQRVAHTDFMCKSHRVDFDKSGNPLPAWSPRDCPTRIESKGSNRHPTIDAELGAYDKG